MTISFCVPSIANLYLRWWPPLTPGRNRQPGAPEHTGRNVDGFGNKIAVWAVANPSPEANHDKLTTRAAGFGIVRFNKPQRTIRMECWPRNVDVTAPDAKPYAGWPVTIQQTDNDGRRAAAYLPTLNVTGLEDPVVQVVDESNGEIVYTLRIKGHTFRPKVFRTGSHTVRVGGQDQRTQAFPGIQAAPEGESKELLVKFD